MKNIQISFKDITLDARVYFLNVIKHLEEYFLRENDQTEKCLQFIEKYKTEVKL